MTVEETGIVMDILGTAYPQFYNSRNAPDKKKALELWAAMFAEDDVQIVLAAVKALIVTRPESYPPAIGMVKEQIRKLQTGYGVQELTAAEAWALVYRAVKRSLYHSVEEFHKLPRLCQRIVGTPEQLQDWAVMDADTVQSVIGSTFQRAYATRRQGEREYEALPESVKSVAAAMVGKRSAKELEAHQGNALERRDEEK